LSVGIYKQHNEPYVICTIRDITLAVDMELQRQALENRLSQSQKMEAIGQLAGGIAHDFNNILGSILGFTGLTVRINGKPDQTDKIDEYLKEVLIAGERAKTLVEQLLAFSRESHGKPVVLAAATAIEGALKLLESTIPSEIGISFQALGKVPNIIMDFVQLEQVVMNLCINAIDAVDSGDLNTANKGGDINITLEAVSYTNESCASCHETVAGKFVQLSIKDNGCGIAAKDIEHLFEPFYTTKEVGEGSGLGLSMAHGILHEYGGHIIVTSELKVGSCFKLLIRPSNVHTPADDSLGKHNLPRPKIVHDAHILIVDDDISLAKFVRLLLEGEGYKVTTCHNAEEALTLFNGDNNIFDLMLTDQAMPKITGMELSKRVLQQKEGFPIILCTGYDKEANKHNCLSIGIKGFMKKPLDSDILLSMIGNILEETSSETL
ncbi:MAG: response regulator, partial [Pseudomonadales bacterium]|nr:response regulator [Pseudomonadales bacterium]